MRNIIMFSLDSINENETPIPEFDMDDEGERDLFSGIQHMALQQGLIVTLAAKNIKEEE